MQTGLEIDQFNANVMRLNLQADPDYQQMVADYDQIVKQLYDNIGLEYDGDLSEGELVDEEVIKEAKERVIEMENLQRD